MKKLNGFDNYIINKAVKHWIEQVEKEVLEDSAKLRSGNLIYAPGYFTMVGKELLEKIDELTIKKQRTNAKN